VARGTVWQGIRDWFRPVDDASQSTTRRAVAPSDPSEPRDEGNIIHTRAWTRAALDGDADPSNVIPFPRSGAGEAAIDYTTPGQAGGQASDSQELLDFLAADVDPVPADPAFRERLREELWEMVVDEGAGPRSDRKDS